MGTILELQNVNKSFEVGTVNQNHVIKDLSFKMDKGDFVTVIGGNGAGKSTFFNIISGNLIPDQGKVYLDGQDVSRLSVNHRAKDIGYVFQDPKMGTAARLTIEENLALANKRGMKRSLTKAVKRADQEAFKQALANLNLGLEDRLTAEVQFLSGGQRQALTLVMATLRKPKILLLDEHTAALDPTTSKMVLDISEKLVKDNHLSALMITHNMEDALKYGNRLIMLHRGRIILDIAGQEKENLTVIDLMERFKSLSGSQEMTDDLLLA